MAALPQAVCRAVADSQLSALSLPLSGQMRVKQQRGRGVRHSLISLRSCSGELAAAWLARKPGFTYLTAIELYINARLRLGEILLAGQAGDTACVRAIDASRWITLLHLWNAHVGRPPQRHSTSLVHRLLPMRCRLCSSAACATTAQTSCDLPSGPPHSRGHHHHPRRRSADMCRPFLNEYAQSSLAITVPQSLHGPQAHDNRSQPDPALTSDHPVTAQS